MRARRPPSSSLQLTKLPSLTKRSMQYNMQQGTSSSHFRTSCVLICERPAVRRSALPTMVYATSHVTHNAVTMATAPHYRVARTRDVTRRRRRRRRRRTRVASQRRTWQRRKQAQSFRRQPLDQECVFLYARKMSHAHHHDTLKVILFARFK